MLWLRVSASHKQTRKQLLALPSWFVSSGSDIVFLLLSLSPRTTRAAIGHELLQILFGGQISKRETENYVLNVSSRKVWQRVPCLYQCPTRFIPYRLPRCGWAGVCCHQTVPPRILLQRHRLASRPMPIGPNHGGRRIGTLFQMPCRQGWDQWSVPSLSREFWNV